MLTHIHKGKTAGVDFQRTECQLFEKRSEYKLCIMCVCKLCAYISLFLFLVQAFMTMQARLMRRVWTGFLKIEEK